MESTVLGEKQTDIAPLAGGAEPRRAIPWVEVLKALALVWIVVNHIVERIYGSPLIGNPGLGWQPLPERIAQLTPLTGSGLLDLPLNLIRYTGWLGDQAVGIFIILSGFGLTWSLLRRSAPARMDLRAFYQRRLLRIYPLWIGAHILFALIALPTGLGIRFTQSAFYLSLLGDRFYPSYLFYYFAPAWWFFGLILQLYLVYPLLWWALVKWGPIRLFAAGVILGIAARTLGLLVFQNYIDMWLRGSVFITRLPEFVTGISAAAWLYSHPISFERLLTRLPILFSLIVIYFLSTASELTWAGNVTAPFLTGITLLGIGFAAFRRVPASGPVYGILEWISRHSLSLFLTHHPAILLLVPQDGKPPAGALPLGVSILLALILTIGFALLLESLVAFGLRVGRSSLARLIPARPID